MKLKNMNKKQKIIAIVATVLVAFVIINFSGGYIAAVTIYSASFGYRCTTDARDAFDIAEFPDLARERHTFTTKQGHTLVGYLYESTDSTVTPKALMIFAHGLGGGGQTGYMDIFNFFCAQGYLVFAYDATANDESEGEEIGGLPQGFIDLDYAITYAEALPEAAELPTVLMGYSWGGLSVANALNTHPDVEAVASLAGWNRSMDMIEYRGCQMVGPMGKVLLPFVSAYEFVTYGGKYAFSSAIKGFENSDCEVLIVHGELDDTIAIEYGYEAYYEEFADDDRFTFKNYADRDHLVMRDEDGNHDMALMAEIAAFFDQTLAN